MGDTCISGQAKGFENDVGERYRRGPAKEEDYELASCNDVII